MDVIFVVSSAVNSVGTTRRLSSQHFAAVSPSAKHNRARTFCFFSFHNHGFCGGRNKFSLEKHQHVDGRDLVTGKGIRSKLINFFKQCQRAWHSGVRVGLRTTLTTSVRVFSQINTAQAKKCGAPLLGLANLYAHCFRIMYTTISIKVVGSDSSLYYATRPKGSVGSCKSDLV